MSVNIFMVILFFTFLKSQNIKLIAPNIFLVCVCSTANISSVTTCSFQTLYHVMDSYGYLLKLSHLVPISHPFSKCVPHIVRIIFGLNNFLIPPFENLSSPDTGSSMLHMADFLWLWWIEALCSAMHGGVFSACKHGLLSAQASVFMAIGSAVVNKGFRVLAQVVAFSISSFSLLTGM